MRPTLRVLLKDSGYPDVIAMLNRHDFPESRLSPMVFEYLTGDVIACCIEERAHGLRFVTEDDLVQWVSMQLRSCRTQKRMCVPCRLQLAIRSGVHGGDRLPWVRAQEVDNYDSLVPITWQVHVYGTPKDDLLRWCAERGIPLRVFNWTTQHEGADLARDAAYLLRPDTYVAVAESSGSAESLDHYLSTRSIHLTASS